MVIASFTLSECTFLSIVMGSSGRDGNLRGQPWKGWVDNVKEAVKGRGLTLKHSRVIVCDSSDWRVVVRA